MLVQINSYIFLSDIESANCKQCLLHNDITAILTVDSEPLDTSYHSNCSQHGSSSTGEERAGNNNNKALFVRLMDDLKTNIIEVLSKCFQFIDDNVKKEEKVLVHW